MYNQEHSTKAGPLQSFAALYWPAYILVGHNAESLVASNSVLVAVGGVTLVGSSKLLYDKMVEWTTDAQSPN
jgi:hypothetical protein